MTRVALALSVVFVLFLSGCATSPGGGTGTNATNSTTGGNATAMAVLVTVGGGVCPPNPPPVSPGSTNYYTLAPAKVTLMVGQKVNLTLKNTGCGAHDLVIQGVDGAKIGNVAAGKEASVEFTPTKAGTYPMYCTLGAGDPAGATSHKDHGMSGSVEVK